MNITAVQNSVNHKVIKPKSFSLTAASNKKELILVEILSTNAANIKCLQTYLSRFENIQLLNIHKDIHSFLGARLECNALFIDMKMMNEELINEIELRAQLKVIGIGSRRQFEKNNLNELLFYFLQLPIMFGELISVINLLKGYPNVAPVRSDVKKYLLVKSEYKIIKINFDDILFIAGMKDYIRIHLKTRATPVTTLQNLKDFEKKLPVTGFIRVHKSYIIAAQHIECISRNEITIGSYFIPVGEAFRSELNKFISENS